jgi:hypothetical protein
MGYGKNGKNYKTCINGFTTKASFFYYFRRLSEVINEQMKFLSSRKK